MSRYALYYAPTPGSALAHLGNGWLGRDPETGADLPPPLPPEALQEIDHEGITRDPRRYGFHGTLKAPFALADGVTPADLTAAIEAFARTTGPASAPPLTLAALGGFLALVPSAPAPDLNRLAADVVAAFDGFRAPLSDADRQRRLASGLTDAQIALLDRWGYPYVKDEFRFHMTLTGALPPEPRQTVSAILAPLCAGLADEPLVIDQIALFHQPDRSSPFRLARRFALTGRAAV